MYKRKKQNVFFQSNNIISEYGLGILLKNPYNVDICGSEPRTIWQGHTVTVCLPLCVHVFACVCMCVYLGRPYLLLSRELDSLVFCV